MKTSTSSNPYYRSNRSTTHIMIELFIGLFIVWMCSIIFYSKINGNILKAIFNPIVAIFCCFFTEFIFLFFKHFKEKKIIKTIFVKCLRSYGYITGMILALLLPIGTSYYVLVISSIFSILVGKILFGGFGHNIFNPAVLGRTFAQVAFLDKMTYDTDLSTGATITSIMKNNGWSLDILSGEISLFDILIGNYRGALGETFTLVIFLIGIVFIIRKVIDWRLCLGYLGSIYVYTFFIGLTSGYGIDSFEFALVQISLGGIMFGSVFCITDPVTSPTSRAGKIIFSLFAALITILIRYLGVTSEGVVYGILIANMFTPLIDSSIKGLSNQYKRKKYLITSLLIVSTLVLSVSIGMKKIDKVQYINYFNNQTNESQRLISEVKRVGVSQDKEIYNVIVKGNLQNNFYKNYGNVRDLFNEDLQKYNDYFENENYQDVKFISEKNNLFISYKINGKKQKEKIFTLKTTLYSQENEDKSKNWIFYPSNNRYYMLDTGYTNREYESIYSIEIDDNLNVIITFANEYTKADETRVAYSTVDFDVYLNWEKKIVVKTVLNSTNASGGVGDSMLNGKLDFNIGDYTINEENAKKAKEFYHKYIELSSPVSFDEYIKFDNDLLIINDVDESIKVGATYSANGYMYAINSVIKYAYAYHKSLTSGKVEMFYE